MKLSEQEIVRIMDNVVMLFLIPKFEELGMNATGEWLDNVETIGADNIGKIRGRDYTRYLAKGRAPGARPPIRAIENWVNAKMGIGGREGLGIAFAVANKIAKEGTTWHPNGSDIVEILESPEVMNYIRGEYTNLLTIQTKSEIERFLVDTF